MRSRHQSGGRGPCSRIPLWFQVIVVLLFLLVLSPNNGEVFLRGGAATSRPHEPDSSAVASLRAVDAAVARPVLVMYAYHEASTFEEANLAFFIHHGVKPMLESASTCRTYFAIIVNGDHCTPCAELEELQEQYQGGKGGPYGPQIQIMTRANEGLDFAAYGAALVQLPQHLLATLKAIIFLNASVRGPFLPGYVLDRTTWVQAYLTPLIAEGIGVVASSLVCLPDVDDGGPGPRIESFAFALTQETFALLVANDIFGAALNRGKTHPHADFNQQKRMAILDGEYRVSQLLLSNGYNVGSHLLRYRGVDFRDTANWRCGGQMHPSRHGAYGDGIDIDPFEAIFVKTQWRVSEPQVRRYSHWMENQYHHRPEANAQAAVLDGPRHVHIHQGLVDFCSSDASRGQPSSHHLCGVAGAFVSAGPQGPQSAADVLAAATKGIDAGPFNEVGYHLGIEEIGVHPVRYGMTKLSSLRGKGRVLIMAVTSGAPGEQAVVAHLAAVLDRIGRGLADMAVVGSSLPDVEATAQQHGLWFRGVREGQSARHASCEHSRTIVQLHEEIEHYEVFVLLDASRWSAQRTASADADHAAQRVADAIRAVHGGVSLVPPTAASCPQEDARDLLAMDAASLYLFQLTINCHKPEDSTLHSFVRRVPHDGLAVRDLEQCTG